MVSKTLNVLIIVFGIAAIILGIIEILPMEVVWRVLFVIAGIIMIVGAGMNLRQPAN